MRNLVVTLVVCISLIGCGKVAVNDNDQNMDAFFYVDFMGAQMPVLVEGNVSSGKFIVVVHGGPGGSGFTYMGNEAVEKLEEDFAVVFYDQRLSDGATNLSNGEYVEPSRAQYASDLNAIINVLKSKYGETTQYYLFGHSWGGELISEFMSTPGYQNQVNGMINVAGALRLSDTWKEQVLYRRELLMEISAIEIAEGDNLELWNEIYDYCESIDTSEILNHGTTLWQYGWDAGFDYLYTEGKIADQDIPGFETIDVAPFIAEGYGNSPGANMPSGWLISDYSSDALGPDHVTERNDQSTAIQNITKPSLIIAGKYDCIVPPKLSIALYNGISTPLAEKIYVELDSTGHSPFYRNLDFYNLVYDFVSQY